MLKVLAYAFLVGFAVALIGSLFDPNEGNPYAWVVGLLVFGGIVLANIRKSAVK